MLYNDYYRRMSKLMSFARAVKKHMLVILLSLFAVLVVTATLLATRGLVYDREDCPSQVEYGQSIGYSAGAFLNGEVNYEYRAEGSTEWTSAPPTRAGKYFVRAVSSRTGGAKSYGNVHTVTILPKKINVTVACTTIVFGDMPSVEAELSYGDNIACTEFVYADCSRTETSVNAVAKSIVITDKNGEDVTYCYDISTPTCPIVFTPRKIGITVADKTAEYDNTPVGFGGYELTDGTLADGNMIVCLSDTTQTEVGEASVNPTFRVLNGDGLDVSANYRITQNTGKISVTQRIVYVTSGTDEGVYSGSGFSCAEYEIDERTSVVQGHRLSLELQSSLTDVGSCDNMMAFKVFDGDGNDVTSNYSIVLTAGALTVTPRPITVSSVDKSWEYDGTAKAQAEVKSVEGLVGGHSVVADKNSAAITDVGTADNDITVTVKAADGTDITSNYKITYNPGTLTVTQKTLSVTSVDEQFIYDGTPQSKNEIASVTGLVDGQTARVDTTDGAYATITDKGTADNEITVIVSDANGLDKTANYKIVYTSGTLTVNERPITVKAKDVSREYDGTPFTSNEYEIISDNKLVLEHIGRATCSGEITEHGTEENTVTGFKVFDGEVDITKNYAVTFADTKGKLTVTLRFITVKSVDETFTYDGTAKFKNEIAGIDRLVDGHTASVVTTDGAYATITDKGTADNDIAVTVSDANGDDKTGNYSISYEPGTLTVTPRSVTVKSASLSKIYDATPLIGEADDFEVVEGNFVLDHKGSAYYDIGRIGVGEMPNVIDEFKVYSGETEVTKNYSVTISEEQGTLTVTQRPIKVIADDKDKKFIYDGKWHGYFDCTIVPMSPLGEDDEAIVGGQTVQRIATTSASLRDVLYDEDGNVTGVPNNMFIVINDGKAPTTQNYSIEYELGTITVTPRPITVKAGSDSKIYDGTPLTSNKFEVTSELGIVEGQVGVASCKGSVIEVVPAMTEGTADNTIEHNFKIYEGEVDKTANYAITYDDTPGTLTVTQRHILVRTEAHEFIYDGEAHDWQRYSVEPYVPPLTFADAAIIDGHHTEVVQSSVTKVTDVVRDGDGKVIGTPNQFFIKVFDENDDDKSYNYFISYTFGKLTVNPRPILVTTADKEFLYDDTDHSHVEYTIAYLLATDGDDKPIIDKHKDEVVSFTKVHDVMRNSNSVKNEVIGTDNNIVIAIKDKTTSADQTHNYDIRYTYGELIVNPRPITVTTWSQSFMYDDTEHSFLSYTISVRAPLTASEPGVLSVHENTVGWYTTMRDVLRDGSGNVKGVDNVLKMLISKKSDGTDQTHNYDIEYVYGTITITPRPIEISTGSSSWIFDGLYHSNTEYSAKALFNLKDGEAALASGHKVWVVNRPVAVRDVKRDKDGNVIGYENNSELKIYRESDNVTTTSNYTITYAYGTLTITPRHITVQVGHEELIDGVNSWVYDGQWHTDKYVEVIDTVCTDAPPAELKEIGLVGGHQIKVELWYSVMRVNRDSDNYLYNNEMIIDILGGGESEKGNYQIHYINGKLQILPRAVTLKTADHAWMYDGVAHYDYTVTPDEETPLADGQRAIRREDSVCEITEVGKKENNFGIIIVGEDGYNNTGNYDITLVYGELEIVEGEGGNGGNGESGGEGDDDKHSGNIGGGDLTGNGEGEGDGESKVLFTIRTDYNGHIYLRQSSYGDYVIGQDVSFLDAEEFNGLITVDGKLYGMNYLPTTILQNKVTKYYINIELPNKGKFVVPYFAAFGDSQIQTSDVWYYLRGTELNCSFNFYPYMHVNDNGAALSGGVDWRYSGLEREYYEFVLSKYLQIPASTKRYLDGIIYEQNFSGDDPNIISKVAKFIQSSAEYNLEYDIGLDAASDKVVAFLRDYKQGVCRHYAAAATMLFRALGIPARFVSGVSANGDGTGNPIEVTSDRAHAWTEVYIAGAGWVPVEVTGSSSLGGGGNGGNGGGGENSGGDAETEPSLVIKPIDVYVQNAPANPINAVIQIGGNINLNYLLGNEGFYYDAVIEESSPGVSEIKSFKLYNRLGMDVTSELGDRIKFLPGKLVVTGRKLISVELPCLEQTYNGVPLMFEPDDYIVLDAPAGYTVTLDLSRIGINSAGVITTEGLRDMLDSAYGVDKWYTVLDASGADVTSQYFISFIGDVTDDEVVESLRLDTSGMTVLTISKKRAAFTSLSISKKYDGTPLEAEISYLPSALVAGHRAEFLHTASITDVGEEESKFSVKIVDDEGVDVTDNYYIEYTFGTLTVTE